MQESQASHVNVEFDAVCKALQARKAYSTLHDDLFQRMLESKTHTKDWTQLLPQIAAATKIESKLKHLINDVSNTIIKPDPIKYDSIEPINQARTVWTEFLVQNLIKVSNKLLERLSHPESKKDPQQHLAPNLFIYDHKNIYAACASTCLLRSKRLFTNAADLKLSDRVSFDPVPIDQLKQTYAEILYDDTNLIGDEEDEESLVIEREKEAEALLHKGGISEMENFARKGLPSGLRVRYYRKYLGIENQLKANKLHKQFITIQENMKGHKYIIDEIADLDILDVLNDEKYFIFDESLKKCIWTFLRDRHVQEKLAILPILPFSALDDINKIIPYCGVIPCSYFARYALPFLYTSERAEEIYFLFREFYCKYFCFLQSLSSHPNSILRLCHLFEEVFYKQHPKLALFLANNGIEPLPIAINWMIYCYIGFLSVEQLFCLFDRIIGYDSLEILAILAVGIFVKRAEKIVKYKSRDRIEEVFTNIKNINVIECIRLALPR